MSLLPTSCIATLSGSMACYNSFAKKKLHLGNVKLMSVEPHVSCKMPAGVVYVALCYSLGAQHDSDGNACLDSTGNIMAATLSIGSDPASNRNGWLFSSCSIDYFNTYITSLDK